mgnify:FL=1
MVLLNFAHSLAEEDLSAIAALAGRPPKNVVHVAPEFVGSLPLVPQVRKMVDTVGFSQKDWQNTSLLVCLPLDSAAAAIFVAEIAGRHGRTPTIVRFVQDAQKGRLVPFEIISLHQVRKETNQSQKGWLPSAGSHGGGSD